MTAPATTRTTIRLLPALLLERDDAIVLPAFVNGEPEDDGLVLVIGADLEDDGTVTLVTEDLAGRWNVDHVEAGRLFTVVRTA